METDVEESDYLGKRWESAVEAIISAINDTTAVPVPKRPDHTTVQPVAPASSAISNSGDSIPAASDQHLGKPPAVSVPKPSGAVSRMSGSAPVAPTIQPPGVTVIPVLFPYAVAGPPVVPHHSDVVDTIISQSPGHHNISHPLEHHNSTGQPPERHSSTSQPPPLQHLHPVVMGGSDVQNYSYINHTTVGVFPPPSGPDAAGVVGWALLVLVAVVAGLAALVLSTSKRLRVWLRHRIDGTRCFLDCT